MTEQLIKWLEKSTCNFLAADTIIKELEGKEFQRLEQNENWHLEPWKKYFMVKNGSAVFAFTTGAGLESVRKGAQIIAAHSDSPCLRLKPHPEIYCEGGIVVLNVEKYGGGILSTWFDRPLSIAGRITVKSDDIYNPREVIFDLKRPVAVIPNLAIHFNRGVNEGYAISVQKDMKPVLGYFTYDEIVKAREGRGIIIETVAKACDVNPDDILDYEISLYPVEAPRIIGLHKEFINSGRIDDLSMVFAGLKALLETCDNTSDSFRILAIFDNEETGSGTRQGAASPVLRDLMERVCEKLGGSKEDFLIGMANSFLISADNAHAWHPNYNEKYDPTNHPMIGRGPVIKVNSNCKYMTDSVGSAIFRELCDKANVPYQMFVNHADVAGGSTLGNILTSQLDLKGVDVGAAIWAMHSSAETGAVQDYIDFVKVFETFWS